MKNRGGPPGRLHGRPRDRIRPSASHLKRVAIWILINCSPDSEITFPDPRPACAFRPAERDRSMAAHRRGNVGDVALGIGQCPPGGRVLVGDEVTACGDRGGDPRLGLVRRHPDVEVDPGDLRVGRVDLLEPDRRPAAAGSTRSSGLSSRSWYPSTTRQNGFTSGMSNASIVMRTVSTMAGSAGGPHLPAIA